MRVAFDISPIKSGHQVRGIGSYTKSLQQALSNLSTKDIEITFIDSPSEHTEADIIHHPYFDIFFKTLNPKKNTKTVVTIHDVIPLVFPSYFQAGVRGYINLFFQKRSLNRCAAIICDSKTSKSDIVEKLSQNPKKIHVVYLAPSKHFTKLKSAPLDIFKKYNLPKNFVLYVGDVNWNKNIANLLNAVKLAQKNIVMVGKALVDNQNPETEKINKLIKTLNIETLVHRTGYVPDPDLTKIYNTAQATVLPSFYEGFGLPILESMACGTPVICSNNSSIAEICGKSAIICDPTDPQDMANKINDIFKLTPEKREALSKKLIQHASKYSWEKSAKETIDVYKSVI